MGPPNGARYCAACSGSANHGFVTLMTADCNRPLRHSTIQTARVPGARLVADLLLSAALSCLATPQLSAAETDAQRGTSGLALPRFVSLKVDRVNLRQGPGTDYPTAWVYHRAGLPVEILKEFEGWRQIRDADGAVGWVRAFCYPAAAPH